MSRRGRYEVMCLGETISTHRTLRAAESAAARYQAEAEREVGEEIWGDGAYSVYERDGVAEVAS